MANEQDSVDNLNMDRSLRVVIETKGISWEKSPSAGVLRKKLEREAAESGQVTSVVQYEPNSRFHFHHHPGGEEIFVLNGTFEDELGIYPQGTWLRNPSYSRHHPFTREGCTIFVKTGHI